MAYQAVTEEEFAQEVEFRFPYEDEEKVASLIQQARAISDNAVFLVLREIVFAPITVSPITKRQLYDLWRDGFQHSLTNPVLEAAEALLEGRELPVERVLDLMAAFRDEPRQYHALEILAHSCTDSNQRVEKKMSTH